MKNKSLFLIAAVVAITASSTNAATIALARGLGNPGITASESSGALIASGGYYIAVGSFEVLPVISDDFPSLLEAVSTMNIFQGGISPTSGVTQGVMNVSLTSTGGANPDLFNSKQIYVLVGNKGTFAESDQWGIFTTNSPVFFPANVTAAGTTTVALPNGAAITPLPNAGSVEGNSFVLVPEPSAALLGLLGAVGLLRRRRN